MLDIVSLCLGCIFPVIIVIILCLHAVVVNKHQVTRQRSANNQEVHDFELKNPGVRALFGNFKTLSFSHEGYLLFAVLRTITFNLVLSTIYSYPLIQAIIILTLNVAMVAYLGLRRPFRRIVDFIQQLTAELILLAVNICVLLLAILDANNVSDLSKRNTIGNAIVLCSLIFKFMPSGFTAGQTNNSNQ